MSHHKQKQEYCCRELPNSEYERWDELVARSPQGTIYSLSRYLDLYCSAFGGTFHVLGVFDRDQLVGGVAYHEMRHKIGSIITNRLLLYYNTIVLDAFPSSFPSQITAKSLGVMSSLAQALQTVRAARLLLHNRPSLNDWRVFQKSPWHVSPGYTYIVSLNDLPTQYTRMEKNTRRLIRRCEEEGCQITNDDDFDSFFTVHEGTHQRKGAPLYLPKKAFAKLFQQLHSAGLAKLFHTRLPGGESVASQLVYLGPTKFSATVCAGTKAEYLKLGVSPFMRWKCIESLADLGYLENDLTDASLNSVSKFKSELGATLTPTWILQRRDSRLLEIRDRCFSFFSTIGNFRPREE